MKKRRIDDAIAQSNMAKLPERCAAINPVHKTSVIIMRGEDGYYPMVGIDVKNYNNLLGVTAQQVEAMMCGSMFGWDTPGANIDNCNGKTAADCV